MNKAIAPTRITRADILISLGTGLAALANYLAGLGRTVGPADSGELTIAALKLGITHPPGYPLFTWLGRLACLVPVEPALATNSLTMFTGAAAIATLYFAARSLALSRPGSVVASLSFAFSATFWQHSTSHEVYAFQTLLLSLLLFTLASARKERPQLILLGAFLFGLALAHQPTALLWLPALLALVLRRPGRSWLWGLLLPAVLFLILGVTSALGTLFRALARPEINWGNPNTLGRFLGHITGRQYQELALAAPLGARFATLPPVLVRELGLPVLGLVVLGLGQLAGQDRPLLLTLLLLIGTGLFGLSYQVPDYQPQLLPALLALCLSAGAAAQLVRQLLGRPGPYLAITLLAAPGYTLYAHLPAGQESRTTVVQDLADNLLSSLPENAVFLAGADVTTNSVRYRQLTKGLRRAVLMVSADMLFARTYHHELSRTLPLPDYETMLRCAGTGSRETRKQSLIDQLVRNTISTRPVYVAIDLLTPAFFEGPLLKQFRVIPVGIVAQIVPRAQPVDSAEVLDRNRKLWRHYRLSSLAHRFRRTEFQQIQLVYAGSRNNLGMFCYEQGWLDPALDNLKLARAMPAPVEFQTVVSRNLQRVQAGIH